MLSHSSSPNSIRVANCFYIVSALFGQNIVQKGVGWTGISWRIDFIERRRHCKRWDNGGPVSVSTDGNRSGFVDRSFKFWAAKIVQLIQFYRSIKLRLGFVPVFFSPQQDLWLFLVASPGKAPAWTANVMSDRGQVLQYKLRCAVEIPSKRW